MPGREADRFGMGVEIGEPDDPPFAHHEAQHAAALRRRADASAGLLVDPGGDEGVELEVVVRQHADGGVARPDDLAGQFGHPLQHALERELGREEEAGRDERLESLRRTDRFGGVNGASEETIRLSRGRRVLGFFSISFTMASGVSDEIWSVIHPGAHSMELRHVVAATDQSAAGHHAVLVAARLAERVGARLTVLTVRPAAQAWRERVGAPVAARRPVPESRGRAGPAGAQGHRRVHGALRCARDRDSPIRRGALGGPPGPGAQAADAAPADVPRRHRRRRGAPEPGALPLRGAGFGRAGPDARVPRRHRTQPHRLPGGRRISREGPASPFARSRSSRSGSTNPMTSRRHCRPHARSG